MGNNAILITGAAGFIGWNLARHFESAGRDIIAGYNNTRPAIPLQARWEHLPLVQPDLTERICTLSPSAIFHCAAIPGTSACENDRKLAFKVNVEASCSIARAAEQLQIPLVYFSTDLVFDGTRGWYDEEDTPNPPSYYGETKLLGEQESLAICSRTYVLRLALTYGSAQEGLAGFLAWTHKALSNGDPLNLFENQYRSVLFVDDIAEIIQRLLRNSKAYGIYHMGGPDRLNRLEIGQIFAQRFHDTTEGIASAWLDRGETLGNIDDTSMMTTKVRKVTGYNFTSYREGIDTLYRNLSQTAGL